MLLLPQQHKRLSLSVLIKYVFIWVFGIIMRTLSKPKGLNLSFFDVFFVEAHLREVVLNLQ